MKRGGINTRHGSAIVKEVQYPIWAQLLKFNGNNRSKRQHMPMSNNKKQHKRILHRLRTIANKIITKVKKAGKKL